jgi:hypothetical protein
MSPISTNFSYAKRLGWKTDLHSAHSIQLLKSGDKWEESKLHSLTSNWWRVIQLCKLKEYFDTITWLWRNSPAWEAFSTSWNLCKKFKFQNFLSRQGNKEFKFGQTNLEPTQHVEKPKLLLLPKLCMQKSPVLHHIRLLYREWTSIIRNIEHCLW